LAAGANITFAKTLNGATNNAQAVTINAGTNGVVLVSGAVGNTAPLSTLTLTNSNGATFNSAVSTGTSVVLSNTVAGQTIRFADNLSTPVLTTTANGYHLELLGPTTNITGTSAATTFMNTGNLVLGNGVGDTLTFAGGLTATAPAAINAAGTVNTTNTAMSLGDSNTALTLADHLTLNTTGGNASAGGSLTLGGAVNGTTANTQSLTLNAGSTGAVSVTGAVGQTTALNTLTLSNSNGATFSSAVTTGTSVVLSNTVAGQTIRFADNLNTPVLTTTANGYHLELLGTTTSITGTSAATTFLNTGNLVLGDAASDTLTFAGGLTATAPAAINAAGTINTSNTAMSLGDSNTALTLADHLTLNTTGGNASAGGSLTLGGAVNGTTANTQSLTLNAGSTGAVSVLGSVGQTTALNTLTLTHSNGATFSSPVSTGTEVVLSNTVAGQTIRFADNLSTPVLTTTANGYHLELLGTTTNITGTSATTTFLNTGNLVLGNAAGDTLTFAGGLTASAPTAISAAGTLSTTNAAIVLGAAPVTLTGNTTVNAGTGAITLGGTVDGAYSLALNSTGATTLAAAVGDGAALTSLTTNTGGTVVIQGARVNTTGAQRYAEPVTLSGSTTLTGTAIRFDDAVTGSGSLSVVGAATLNGATVTTQGAQTYNGAVTLLKNTVLDANAAQVSFTGTVDGGFDLTVNTTGTTSFGGDVGAGTPLTSLTTNAGGMVLINAATVHTTGDQTFHDIVSLQRGTTFTASVLTFNDAVVGAGDLSVVGAAVLNAGTISTSGAQSYSAATTLMRDTVLTAGAGGVSFGGAVDGAYALTVNTRGDTTFLGTVGATQALTNLTTDASTAGSVHLSGGSVTTTGAQSYGEAVVLGANTTLSSTGSGDISFGNTLDGAYSLAVNTAGVTRFNGVVGAGTALSSLTTDAPGSVVMNAGTVTTSGAQTYNDAMSLSRGTTLTSSADTLHFVSIADGVSSFDLNVNTATALALADVDIGGNLHVTTQATGVAQQASTHVWVGGTSTFTADTGTLQDAALTSTDNRFAGLLTLNAANNGSWRDVSVKTTVPLSVAPLQSAGAVSLATQGAALTTSSISTSGSVSVDTRDANGVGGPVSLGAATVSGNLAVQTGGGNVAQTGQLVVTGNTSVTAGTGTVTLLNALNSFGGTLALQGTSTSVATSGNLQLASVNNTGPMVLRAPNGAIDLGTAFITGGDLTLESLGNMSLGGANITGSLNMSSTQGTVSFGQATVTGDLTATTQGNQVDLGSANVGGSLNVQTNGGNVVQQPPTNSTPNAALHVTGTTNINAGTGNVTLPNIPNQFGAAISLQANDVQLVGSNNLILGPSTITGNAQVTAATGNITQTAPLSVAGTSTLTATLGDVTLDQANTLTQTVTVSAMNATLNTNTALALGASTVTGNLAATVATGDITQTGPLVVTGTSNLATPTGNITLTDTANSFGSRVSVDTPQALQLNASSALSMGVVNVGLTTNLQSHGKLDLGTSSVYTGKLTANSGGFDIIQSGPLKAGKDVDFDAGTAKIDLFDPKNLWLGALYFKGGIIMINHPQLMNAVNSGVLMVRAETTVVSAVSAARVGGDMTNTSLQTTAGTGGSTVSVVVNRAPSTSQTGVIQVQVAPEAAAPGKSFSFELDPHAVAGHAPDAPVKISQMDGKPLPNWLRYDATNKTFTANEVPAGAFPLQLKVFVGNTETVMLIQEKPQK